MIEIPAEENSEEGSLKYSSTGTRKVFQEEVACEPSLTREERSSENKKTELRRYRVVLFNSE